jgi:galactokinase
MSPAASFEALFQRPCEANESSPGRVNLIGDHTDYNGGYVLPMVLPQQTSVEGARRDDRRVKVWSQNVDPAAGWADYVLGGERRVGDWVDYVQAATAVLAQEGYALPGLDLRVVSSVPLGAGLSSSAALLVAILRVCRSLLHRDVPDETIARLAHRAETEWVGAPVGVMDQMVCALGRRGFAFFLDTATLDYRHIPLPASVDWVVIHSGVHHSHATGGYAQRRHECEDASRRLGVRWLRDLEGQGRRTVLSRIEELPPPLSTRARHVILENERVLAAVELLKAGDLTAFGSLMNASHASLRDDFAVSTRETDLLVELAQAEPATYGARLTGGGFGGSVVVAVKDGTARDVGAQVASHYRRQSGQAGIVLLPVPEGE